jgi:hypothetical protein
MGPFKKFCSQEIELWLDNHPCQAATALHVSEIFGKASLRIASMQTAINGFKKCSIIPFNPLVFEDVDFIPDKSSGNEGHATPKVSTRKEPDRATNVESAWHEHVGASTSRFSPFDLLPPPSLPGPSTSGRGGGKAAVVTSSPYQRDLRKSVDKSKKKKKRPVLCQEMQKIDFKKPKRR